MLSRNVRVKPPDSRALPGRQNIVVLIIEKDSHTFVVRIRFEPREIKGSEPFLRGTIEHVASGRRKHFQELSEITPFIESFYTEAREIVE